jgi:serine phosphatase RsbU (regulator of sigma subunit)
VASQPAALEPRPAALIVTDPSGNRSRVPLHSVPFLIGRQADNHLVLRDNRASRVHARIVCDDGEFYVEDAGSRNGVFLNGERVQRRKLEHSDRIELGVEQSYRLVFTQDEEAGHRLLGRLSGAPLVAGTETIAKLRAVVEVARAMQNSMSTEDVLAAVVDAALAVTNSERGFLLLRDGGQLDVRVARDMTGHELSKNELRVPANVIQQALDNRRELLSMNFNPHQVSETMAGTTVAELELRSVIAVPLVRVRPRDKEHNCETVQVEETTGLIYLDSTQRAADLASGNRELLETLALEASTILENARLLEEERKRQHIEEELRVAREIQASLLPRELPSEGWFRAIGTSMPSHQVGGDFFDVRQIAPDAWSVIVADVSGKGVSSALLASLLEGAFLMAAAEQAPIPDTLQRVNRFLLERTAGEKYVTVFLCVIAEDGTLTWSNAGHCPPLHVRAHGFLDMLRANGLPVGMLEEAGYTVTQCQLAPGDKIVIYSDGISEAINENGTQFGSRRVRDVVVGRARSGCREIHDRLTSEIREFTQGCEQSDDMTVVVLEYRPPQS